MSPPVVYPLPFARILHTTQDTLIRSEDLKYKSWENAPFKAHCTNINLY